MYLHNRPRSVIVYCLDRKAKGERFLAHSVREVDGIVGTFEVEKELGSRKTVNFGSNQSQIPSCTCTCNDVQVSPTLQALLRRVFHWAKTTSPKSYLQSTYLSTMLKHYDISKEQQVELSCVDTTNDNPDATSEGASEPQVIDQC